MGISVKYLVFFFFFFFFFIISHLVAFGSSTDQTSTLSGFHVDPIRIWPYSWDYIRVALPDNFSSATIAINSDVTTDLGKVHKYHSKAKLPIICFKDGGLPLPDFSKASLRDLVISDYNVSAGNVQFLRNVDQCYPLQKNVTFKMPYGEFVPGVYYAGLFNGLGNIRNQPNWIKRGSIFSYSANVTIEGCVDPTKHGQYCDQTVENLEDKNYTRNICLVNKESKVYSLNTFMPNQITVKANAIRYNQTRDSEEISITCHARANGIPNESFHDYSSDLSKSSMVIQAPEGDSWYFSIRNAKPEEGVEVCFTVEWEINYCPDGKDGPNCAWNEYYLEEVYQANQSIPIVYFPDGKNKSSGSATFPLEPLLSKSLYGEKSGNAWTYFYLWTNIASQNLHIQLNSDQKMDYEMYVRFNGVANSDLWDYKYSNNKISGNNKDDLVKLYDSNETRVNLFILYAREGWWSIGLRHQYLDVKSLFSPNTTMGVSIETSPNNCSHHGTSLYAYEASGSTTYNYCWCDIDQGGFDCSVALRPKWHSMLVIGTNAVAILPAFMALYQKECPEWVVFMASGISSAFYHTCDEHRYCALDFRILQFMDFWMSFLAVVSTFVYLTNVNESVKRTIHTISAIGTALLAITSPTRSSNIPIVLSLGASGLLIGWIIELSNRIKSSFFPSKNRSQEPERFEINVKKWSLDLVKEIYRHFRWIFILLGFIALTMAIVSRVLEDPATTYWKWHSLWHVSIYMCPFFFLCSKRVKRSRHSGVEEVSSSYELAEIQDMSKDEENQKDQNEKIGSSKNFGQP